MLMTVGKVWNASWGIRVKILASWLRIEYSYRHVNMACGCSPGTVILVVGFRLGIQEVKELKSAALESIY